MRETRGRKRKFNPAIPAHIDQAKIPDNCYWDNSGSGHWYRPYKDETGRARREKVASRYATLAELHKILEECNGIDRDTFNWLADEFQKSAQYKELKLNTRKGYDYTKGVIANHPTRINKPLGTTSLKQWTTPTVQKLVDQIADTRGPTSANACLRYLRRLLRWGKNRGYVLINAAEGVESAKEVKKQTQVTDETYIRLINYAKVCGKLQPKTAGSAPYYIWMVLEIAYLCRLRGIEVCSLTEDKATEQGLICERTKGSRTNIAEWNPRLKAVWDLAIKKRDEIWKKQKHAIPLKPESRPLFVNISGDPLKKSAVDSAWQRFIIRAIADNIITKDERFSPHDMKRKGATDTKGTRHEKQEATGHRSAAMMDVYDKSVSLVKPSGE